MKLKLMILATIVFSAGSLLSAQPTVNDFIDAAANEKPPFSDCAAVFFKDKMLVDEYSPDGKCKLEEGMKGKISVSTVELGDNYTKALAPLTFKVAIKNDKTKTLWMFSDEEYLEIKLEDILKKCLPGDKIVILMVNQLYALPHNVIEVIPGC